MKLSVTLAVYNEEKYIGKCLEAIKDLAHEIIVVDGCSTDQTAQIAKKFSAKVIEAQNDPINFHKQKKLANDHARGDWILQLDADEIVSPELATEIKDAISNDPEENGFWIPRKNYFLGRFLTKGGVYPDYTLRLYRRGKGNLPAKSVHEQAIVEGKVSYLKNPLLHNSNQSFSEYVDKRFNRYTDIMATEVNDGLFQYFFWRPLFDPMQGFIPVYFRHLGLLDGFPGFIWALFQALNFPVAYLKSIEVKEGRVKFR